MEFKLLNQTEYKIMSCIWHKEHGCTEAEIQNSIKMIGSDIRKERKVLSILKELEINSYIERKNISGEYFYMPIIDIKTYKKMLAGYKMGYEEYSKEDKRRIREAIESLTDMDS